jgi:SAM-dependent methyltransferase
VTAGFFKDASDEEELEARSQTFWDALIDHIRRDGFSTAPRHVLDVGCHRGGLLAKVAQLWQPEQLTGIEPLQAARARARVRLQSMASGVSLLHPDEWHRVSDLSVDLLVCHEVLYLLPSLDDFVRQVTRVLAPEARAYVVLGCHTENPVWPSWKRELQHMGHDVFDHNPMDVLAVAWKHKLRASVRPLREGGWATHDPQAGGFTFPTVGALLDHQFRHKLLFRLLRIQ